MSNDTCVTSSHGTLHADVSKEQTLTIHRCASPDICSPVPQRFTSDREKCSYNQGSGNELLVFVGSVAILAAVLNSMVLSFTYDILGVNSTTPIIIIINGTTTSVSDSNNTVGTSATDQVILICFYLAMFLCLCAGAFAWLMHDDVLKFVWGSLGKENVDTNHLPVAVKNGALFWVVSFMIPSVLLTSVGLQVLVWGHGTIAIGVAMSLGMCLCTWQVYRVLRNIGQVTGSSDSSIHRKEKSSQDGSHYV